MTCDLGTITAGGSATVLLTSSTDAVYLCRQHDRERHRR